MKKSTANKSTEYFILFATFLAFMLVGAPIAQAVVVPPTYTITATSGSGGGITPSGDVTVTQGGELVFTITPEEGYQVLDLSVDEVSEDPAQSYTFSNVQAHHTIHATFEPVPSDSCELALVPLYAGQYIDVGTVTVEKEENSLKVTFSTVNDFSGLPTNWYLEETHLAVATTGEEFPQTKSGNPRVGKFAYQETYDPVVQEYTYVIDLNAIGLSGKETLYIAAHAAVVEMNEAGEPVGWETAWGDGLDFPGRNWATYFSVSGSCP